MTCQELNELLELLRKHGVEEYRCGDMSVCFSRAPDQSMPAETANDRAAAEQRLAEREERIRMAHVTGYSAEDLA